MAFPTTLVGDTFTRADEDPLLSPWAQLLYASAGMRLVSTVATGRIGAGSASYLNIPSFGQSMEIYGTLATKWSADGISAYVIANIQSAGVAASEDFYLLGVSGLSGDIMEVYRVDNEVPTLLGATVTGLTITVGDKFGLENINGRLSGYQYNNASWNLRVTRLDNTYGSGKVAIGADNETVAWDDIGGGNVVIVVVRSYARNRRAGFSVSLPGGFF